MTDVREFIRDRLARAGLSMKEASERIGRNHAYLQQFLERGVPVKLPEDVRERLAPLLEVTPDQLKTPSAEKGFAESASFLRIPLPDPRDRVPVMGIAEGGANGHSLWNGEIVDYVDRPPSLAGAPNGYATYVTGTSMEPRYHPGELIYVHPGKPVTVGCYVLVQLTPTEDGTPPPALIKRLVKRMTTKIVLEQFNPSKTFEIAVKDVLTIHKVVGSGE